VVIYSLINKEDLVGLCLGGMESFGLSREDAQDRDYWRLRIKEELANPGLPGKRPLKRCVARTRVCVCMCHRI